MPRHRSSEMSLRTSAQPALPTPQRTRPIPIARGRSMTRHKSAEDRRPERSARPPARDSESPPLLLGQLDDLQRPSTPARQANSPRITSAAPPALQFAHVHSRHSTTPSVQCRFCREWCHQESLEVHRRTCVAYQRHRRHSNSDALLRFVKTSSSVPPQLPASAPRPQPSVSHPPSALRFLPPPPPLSRRRSRKLKVE